MKQRRIDTSLEALLANEARLLRVLDGSEQGCWDWDLETDNFVVSEQLLNQADNGLYQAKNSSRNRLCIGFSCRSD